MTGEVLEFNNGSPVFSLYHDLGNSRQELNRGLKADIQDRNAQVEEAEFGARIAELQTLIAEDRSYTIGEYKAKSDEIQTQTTKFEQQIQE